ncbi:2-oxo-4-hydroxy-4-carboxy-5-ureidoimidazoline decarboxylase [Planctobacterium marinum]|uniref:2-oxo-4-hydroxy-4-carboxy-5-ureidoimidazoline decarboxylase n=1 Tax=Planctobacterium marinum TaxID=1631968 RepID=A0AA48HJJ0_9ALTE|nr:hypothetical protein MACH26_19500 [Planctobacterium marinum]
MTLEELNQLEETACIKWFEQTCAVQIWCQKMTSARPFQSASQISTYAELFWQQCRDKDYLQAFEAHPMIGNVDTLREKFADTKNTAASEQAGAQAADEQTLQLLHQLNHEYLNKHGFIFIVFATGKSAAQMLEILQQRLPNDTETEIKLAAAEQLKITLLRINKQLQTEGTL